MNTLNIINPVGHITGVWKFTRGPSRGIRARSTPDHLLHLLIRGSYKLKTNGRVYEVGPGSMIYYYASEDVEWIESRETVVFYSVAFTSGHFKPLPLGVRVLRANRKVASAFERLFQGSLRHDPLAMALGTYCPLMEILDEIRKIAGDFRGTGTGVEERNIWSGIEQKLRAEKNFRPRLPELCDMAHVSRATLIRLCRKATGLTPMARIRQMRMAEAEGLLQFSTLNITQISEHLGYPRIHEFSREVKKHFGIPPKGLLHARGKDTS